MQQRQGDKPETEGQTDKQKKADCLTDIQTRDLNVRGGRRESTFKKQKKQ